MLGAMMGRLGGSVGLRVWGERRCREVQALLVVVNRSFMEFLERRVKLSLVAILFWETQPRALRKAVEVATVGGTVV